MRALFHHLQDVRDHFASPLDQDGVADLQSQAFDLVHIVECGTADSDASDLHRFEHGDRRQRAGPADLHANVVDHGGFLPRRILVRDGPTRRFGGVAQFTLNSDGIHLDHHADDLVRQSGALGLPGVAIGGHGVDAVAQLPIVGSAES